MYFFETIEGLKGENLTTAVLKYLLMNSSEVRTKFVELLVSKLPPSQVPTFKNGINCETEIETDHGEYGKGRIDLLITADNCLICLENKLWAELQEHQPEKYIQELEKLRESKYPHSQVLLVVVSPEDRLSVVKRKVSQQKIDYPVIHFSWQKLIDDTLKGVSHDSTSNQVVISFLIDYLKECLGHLNLPRHKVLGEVEIGNQYHYELLGKLQQLIQDCDGFSVRKIAPGFKSGFIGFGFDYVSEDRIYQNWLALLKTKEGHVELILEFHEPTVLAADPKHMIEIDTYWEGATYKYDWEKWPDTMAEWRDFLQSPLDLVERAASQKTAEQTK